MSPSDVHTTPLVRKIAASAGVDLSKVKGTGAGGRINPADVQAAAGFGSAPAVTRPQLAPAASLPSASSRTVAQQSTWNRTVIVQISSHARNPLVDDARQASGAYAAAAAEAPPPTLFASGDLPLFVASGAAPEMLLQLPWVIRHPAAVADAQTFARLLERYMGADGADCAAMDYGPTGQIDQGNQEYRHRVQMWLIGPPHDPYAGMGPASDPYATR